MVLCRCPHCQSTFQVSIPPESKVWDHMALDEDGLALWVCLDCNRKGLPAVRAEAVRLAGHDTSYRRGDDG